MAKILIANRGEIARRVVRTARRMGYRTVAVYASADAGAPFVEEADEAVPIGGASPAASYLSIAALLEAARRTGAWAVHPGYGFLAESADFARACGEAGLVFIGPPAEAIALMADKRAARRAVEAAGVRCVPGYGGDDASEEAFAAAAERIGYPVMVKAAAGGGGRGMRLVASAGELSEALRSARIEAQNAFGDGALLLEKAIGGARHVEVQVFGDAHGNLVHLGERDCSTQRRHQKVIEECPSPAVGPELRARMGQAAIAVARAAGHVNAGTVELLLDRAGAFYFLEMNTRLQVEHPVTELVTGIDLVEWQIRVARGEKLPLTQDRIAFSGHAIEARLYAEDPARGYLPQSGVVEVWRPSPAARVDSAIAEGSRVSPHYDPLVAKVVAHGSTRDEARRLLSTALRDTLLFGVASNKQLLVEMCEHERFAAGEVTTDFLETAFEGEAIRGEADGRSYAVAGLALYLARASSRFDDELIGWRSGGPIWSLVRLEHAGRARELRIEAAEPGRSFEVACGDESFALEVAGRSDGCIDLLVDGVVRRARFHVDRAGRVWIDDGVRVRAFEDATHRPARREGQGSGRLVAPLDGAVIEVRVRPDERVDRGQVLVVIEAMKMEHRVAADAEGIVAAVHVRAGEQVKSRQLLAEIDVAMAAEAEGG